MVELQPGNSQALMELGVLYLRQDQPQQAQEQFAKLVAQEPENATAHAALGVALAEQQK